jgi:hypothetical protein
MEERTAGISRRVALKRIGAGAAIAWTAPALVSIDNAFAAGSPAPGAPSGAFPCSYATILFCATSAADANGNCPINSLLAMKLNDPINGQCNLANTDGQYGGNSGICMTDTTGSDPIGPPCHAVQYSVGCSQSTCSNVLMANGTCIPVAASCPFTIDCCKVTANPAYTIQFVLIHDGSINGTVANGTTICGPITSLSAPTGACGNGGTCAASNGCP